ncbi:DUF3253 domain-containing protein [Kineococcus sp. SYSU DK004]|uniref:DUF3253 domain-containing protein n=1 Tax=Kineococcus sp. SYSU DK004 TaxID=3383125 RepID=UPI003D7E8ED6
MPRRSADAPSRASVRPPEKDCAVCGRTITWRRKWERDWDAVRYCSDACRRRARGAGARVDAELERVLEEALDAGGRGGVTPEEVARAVGGQEWRPLLEPARAAARRLVAAGRAQLVQDGRVVDPSTARGPVRVRRPR